MKIAYDPIYNFHSGYHDEIVSSTADKIEWIKSSLINFYEDCAWNSRNIDLRSSLFNHGYFASDTICDAIFSPHIFLENKIPYILELEKVNWLFSDDYKHASLPVDPWKIKLFEELVLRENLKAIIWYSKSAVFDFFNQFVPKYSIMTSVAQKIEHIGHTIYPASTQLPRADNIHDTRKNQFVIVANQKNWYRKGLDIAISIFTKLHRKGIINWNFKIVGGSLSDELTSKIHPIKNNVEIVGLISKDTLLGLLSESSCLLSPSRAETFGTVIVQALNSGCYVVASSGKNTFATKEILEPCKEISKVIESIGNKDEFDLPNETQLYETIKHLILNPQPLSQDRPKIYSRTMLSKNFIKVLSKMEL